MHFIVYTAFSPYALNVRTNISSYGPLVWLIKAYYCLADKKYGFPTGILVQYLAAVIT